MAALPALSALVLAAAAGAGVDVRATGSRLDVHARSAPLAEVLDRLSRETGMKIVYEGPPPRQLVTATLVGRTPAEAVLGILEGLGLNYAVAMDATGTRVQTLLMAGSESSGLPATSAPPAFVPAPAPPEISPPQPEEPAPEEETPPAPEEGEAPAGQAETKPEAEGAAPAPQGPPVPAPVVIKPGFDPFAGSPGGTYAPPMSPFGPVVSPKPPPKDETQPQPPANKPDQ